MIAAWNSGTTAPMSADCPESASYPTSMLAADEAELLWRWLTDDRTELISVSGALATPALPVPFLDNLG